MAGGGQPKLPRRPAVQQPRRQNTILDHGARRGRRSLAVEQARAQAAHPARIVTHRDAGCEHTLAPLVLQKRRAAGDRGAVDCARQMPEQAPGNARIIEDGQFRGLRLHRVQPRHRALPGAAADLCRIVQIGQMYGGVVVEVPLHAGAGTGQRAGGYRMARAHRAAGEPSRGDQHSLVAREAGLRPFRIGHPGHRQCGLLGRGGAVGQCRHVGLGRIVQVQGRRYGRRRRCRRGRNRDRPGPRAPSPRHARRAARSWPDRSLLEETIADFCPTNTRSPRSRPSDRSTCSVLPRRRWTESDVPLMNTASAASAPAARAWAMRSCSRSSWIWVMGCIRRANRVVTQLSAPADIGQSRNPIVRSQHRQCRRRAEMAGRRTLYVRPR